MARKCFCIFAMAWLGCALLGAGEIEQMTFRYRATVKGEAYAEKAETITNPLRWPQIMMLAEDGSYVKKGEVVTEFDIISVQNELDGLLAEKEVIEARLVSKITQLRNRDMELRDSLEELNDNLSVLETRLERYRAMPDPDEVKIAEGRLRVASLAFEASRKDMEKAEDRFRRKMISRVERDEYKSDFMEKKARIENARKHLAYARLKATDATIRKTELQIENLTMERDKLEKEIKDNAVIADIERRGASARKELIESRIKEKREDLEKTRIVAPLSGYLMHLRPFKKRVLQSGDKMRKNFPFMKIPDPTTIAFKGLLLESDRKFFDIGDKVSISVLTGDGAPFPGAITSISKFSHDISEKEEGSWGGPKKSGVMVYDIVIKPETRPDWLKIGMHADCELISSREVSGPTVPISYVKEKDGDLYVSINGQYRKVTGSVIGGNLLLDDKSLLGKTADMYGSFDKNDADEKKNGAKAKWSGNLEPADTADVTVKRIYRWQKVTWLIPEDVTVKKGDVVVRLDTRETDEDIKSWESRFKEAESAREALAEEINVEAREAEFNLKRERNLLEIAEINLREAEEGVNSTAIYDAQLTYKLAVIRLDDLKKKLKRLESKPEGYVSKKELQDLRRDKLRAELQLETAQIKLNDLLEGEDEIDVAKARLEYLSQKLSVENLVKEFEKEKFRLAQDLRRAKRRERHMKRRLDERREWRKNLVLTAPRDGVVQYAKLYSSGVIAKVSIGTPIGRTHVPIRIADISKMFVRIELSERYFTSVRKDMPVEVRIPALSDEVLSGYVSEVEFLFENKRKKDTDAGLYSGHESLGETVFYVRVQINEQKGVRLKPGAVAHVSFPFDK